MSAVVAHAPRSLRWILAVYPASWREKYGDDALATLSDVVDEKGRLPIAEAATLLAHGAAIRLRTSVGFWATLVLLGLVALGSLGNTITFAAPRYWTSVLSFAMVTLAFAVPFAAGITALRSRRITGSPSVRLRAAARDALPGACWVLAVYGATVVLVLAVAGWPTSPLIDPRILIAVVALSLTSVAVGTIAAHLMPRLLATFVAVVAMFIWLATPWGNDVPAWRSVTGSALVTVATWIDAIPLPAAIWSVSLIAVAVLLVAALVVALPHGQWRYVAFAVVSAVALAASLIATPQLAAQTSAADSWQALWTAQRSSAELVCEGSAPKVCLWPEQEAEAGMLVRHTIQTAVAQTAMLGIPVPTAVGVTKAGVDIGWSGPATTDSVITNYASGLVAGYIDPTPSDSDRSLALSYALALVLGADPSASLPGMSVVSLDGVEKHLDVAESHDALGVHSIAEARQLVGAWVANGVPGVRKP
jgi:hypothetical protein